MTVPKITLADAVKSARAQRAVGLLVNEDGEPATEAQVQTWLVRQLRPVVLRCEVGLPIVAQEDAKRKELKAEGW